MKRLTIKNIFFLAISVLILGTMFGCKRNDLDDLKNDPMLSDYVTYRSKPETDAQEPVEGTAKKFKVNKVFSDNMVLQRDEYIRIYGFAEEDDEGKIVTATFKGLNGSASVKNGEWVITLGGTLPASSEMGHTLYVSGAEGVSYEFENVLVGDVFWVVGQSNIQYNLNTMLTEQPDSGVELVKGDAIRVSINNTSTGSFDASDAEKQYNNCMLYGRSWSEAYMKAKQGSAIGYTFAKKIYDANNGEVPIGIITFECSGAALSAFMPPEVCEAKGIGNTQDTVNGSTTTRWIWNQMMYPYRHMTISGLVWYQGESDCLESLYPIYAENLAATLTYYRDAINQNFHDFPIFIVELPSIYMKPADAVGDWAFLDLGNIRGAMSKVTLLCENTFISAGADVWKDRVYWNSLHPKCKVKQSERLVGLALSVLYGKEDINNAEGPVAVHVKYAKNNKSATVFYRSTGNGLKSVTDNIKGYQVLIDGKWVDAEKVIIKEKFQVKVSSSKRFYGVRYNCVADNSYPEQVGLSNSNGIPAIAFMDKLNK